MFLLGSLVSLRSSPVLSRCHTHRPRIHISLEAMTPSSCAHFSTGLWQGDHKTGSENQLSAGCVGTTAPLCMALETSTLSPEWYACRGVPFKGGLDVCWRI